MTKKTTQEYSVALINIETTITNVIILHDTHRIFLGNQTEIEIACLNHKLKWIYFESGDREVLHGTLKSKDMIVFNDGSVWLHSRCSKGIDVE